MSGKLKILVVEDEEAIRRGLLDVLVFHGFEVDFAVDGQSGLKKAQSREFDLILLDVMLPEMNGYDVCESLRVHSPDLPIIMLTAKSSDEEIIHGLRLGADDYVAKPFSIEQLVLRIQAVLRRSNLIEIKNKNINLPDGRLIDTQNYKLVDQDRETLFTKKEIEIIVYLSRFQDRPVGREELLEAVWGYRDGQEIETRTVDIHIAKIRRKIESDSGAPEILITVRGAGYRLVL